MKNEQIRAELDAILSTLLTDKKMLQNDKRIIAVNAVKEKISASNKKFRELNPFTTEEKTRMGDAMRGKTLEEILGEERAAAGKQARSQAHLGKKRAPEVGAKISATRRANGSYENNGMTGKEHKQSTKSIMSIKAEIRQDLKRRLGLGRNDSLDKELLAKEYKRLGL
jgi:hypothetical protein